MSGATGTISASPPPSSPAATSDPAPPAGETDPTQSFTEVLSGQRDRTPDAPPGPEDAAGREPSSDGRPASRRDADGSAAAKAGDLLPLVPLVPPLVPPAAPGSTTPPELPGGTATGGGATVVPGTEAGLDSGLGPVGPVVLPMPASDRPLPVADQTGGDPLPPDLVPAAPLPVAAAGPPRPDLGPDVPAPTSPGGEPASATLTTTSVTMPSVGSGPPGGHGSPARSLAGMIPPPDHGVAGPATAPAARPVTVEPPASLAQEPAARPGEAPASLVALAAAHGAGSVARPESAAVATSSTPFDAGSAPLDLDALTGSLSRPLSGGNGSYTVSVALHPPELGHVQAVMTLAGNDLQVSITAQTQRGHDALLAAADALKSQLARGGVNVNVTLSDPRSPSDGDDRRRGATAGGGTDGEESSPPEAPSPPEVPSGQIHLVL
jgi:hypothetical protein